MKYKFLKILNLDNPENGISFVQCEGEAPRWTFHPEKTYAANIKYTATEGGYNEYHSKTSLEFKSHKWFTIRTYGEEKPILVKGWKFPTTYRGEVYMSASGKTSYDSIKFKCVNPDGRQCDVDYKGSGDIKELFGRVIAYLTSKTDDYPTCYYFDINRW